MAEASINTVTEFGTPVEENGSAASDARVLPAGTHRRGALRWGYFLLLNAIAGSIAAAFFVALLYADGLDPYLRGTYEWLLAHPGVTSFAAFSPMLCSLLVGYGYASRARKRKAAAARRAARGEKAESVTVAAKTNS